MICTRAFKFFLVKCFQILITYVFLPATYQHHAISYNSKLVVSHYQGYYCEFLDRIFLLWHQRWIVLPCWKAHPLVHFVQLRKLSSSVPKIFYAVSNWAFANSLNPITLSSLIQTWLISFYITWFIKCLWRGERNSLKFWALSRYGTITIVFSSDLE